MSILSAVDVFASLMCPNSVPQFQPEKEAEVKKDEKPCQQMVESVTSDLTCSITSDLSQVGSSLQSTASHAMHFRTP